MTDKNNTQKIWQDYLFGHKSFSFCLSHENTNSNNNNGSGSEPTSGSTTESTTKPTTEYNRLNTLELHYPPQTFKNGFIVRYSGKKAKTTGKINRFLLFDNHLDFYDFIHKNDVRAYFHEIKLAHQPRKPYFDIDMAFDIPTELVNVVNYGQYEKQLDLIVAYIISGCEKVLAEFGVTLNKSEDVTLCTSNGLEGNKYKISAHIVLNKFYHVDYLEAEAFCTLVMSHIPSHYHSWIDQSVYKSFQNFRIVRNYKCDSQRKKILRRKIKIFDCTTNNSTELMADNIGTIDPLTDIMAVNNLTISVIDPMTDMSDKLVEIDYNPQPWCKVNREIFDFECCLLKPFTTNVLPIFGERAGEINPALKRRILSKEINVHEDEPLESETLQYIKSLLKEKFPEPLPFKIKEERAYSTLIDLERVAPYLCQTCSMKGIDVIHESENPFIFIKANYINFDCRRSRNHLGVYKTLLLGMMKTADDLENEPEEEDFLICKDNIDVSKVVEQCIEPKQIEKQEVNVEINTQVYENKPKNEIELLGLCFNVLENLLPKQNIVEPKIQNEEKTKEPIIILENYKNMQKRELKPKKFKQKKTYEPNLLPTDNIIDL